MSIETSDIPMARVQEAVQALLGLPDLHDVISVEIRREAVEAEVYARDSEGRYFGSNEAERHTIVRRIVP